MTKTFLIFCFILIGLGQTKAQLRMEKAEAMEAMSTLAYTVQTKTAQEGEYEFIHYLDTKLKHEVILRINQEGRCDQLITVMPIDQWEEYAKIFNGEAPTISGEHTWTASGKNKWKKDDGKATCTLIPHDDKHYFSMVMATPDARN